MPTTIPTKKTPNAKRRLYITDGRGRRYVWLDEGRAGNVQTLAEMRKLVRHDLGLDRGGELDDGLLQHAQAILTAAKVPGRQQKKEVSAIFAYVRDRFTYRKDPTGGNEDIYDAREAIRSGTPDCDGYAVTLATLLAFVGYQSRFVVARYNEATRDGFDHVYLEVRIGERWYALDGTNSKAVVGWEQPGALERRTFAIFTTGDPQLEGFKSVFKKIGSVALPIAAGFIPGVGGVVAGAAAGMIPQGGGGGGNGKNTGTRERMQYLQNKKSSKRLDKQETGELAQLEAAYKAQDEAVQRAEEEKQRREDERQAALIAAVTGARNNNNQFSGVPPLALAGIGLFALLVVAKR